MCVAVCLQVMLALHGGACCHDSVNNLGVTCLQSLLTGCCSEGLCLCLTPVELLKTVLGLSIEHANQWHASMQNVLLTGRLNCLKRA